MQPLYPEIRPFAVHRLRAGRLHELYVEECGNPRGIPVIFLHGGPGSGCNESHRRYFDPDRYRVILFDQRGCHRSVPRGGVEENSTVELLQDIERLREKLEVDRWVLYGGSWGATLALLYAELHPGRASAVVLRGAFLARSRDLEWFVGDGARRVFPEHWTEFAGAIPEAERVDLVSAYHRRIHGHDPAARLAAARGWSMWGTRVTTYLLSSAEPVSGDAEKMLAEAAVETHYAFHGYFIEEDQILRDIGRMPRVPVRIVHGRRDLTCTLDASWALHRAIPGSRLNIVEQGGHLAGEPVMTDALVRVTDEIAGLLR